MFSHQVDGNFREMFVKPLAASSADQVNMGNKIVEVRSRGINKGTAIKKILLNKEYDFVFAVGDDKTDEDMFKTLVGRENCFTIKVGPNASYAQYNLLKPQMVISLLEGFNYLPVSPPVH